MVRRTIACFDRVYQDLPNPPRFVGCPIFVPQVGPNGGDKLIYTAPAIAPELMWKMDRFLDLVMGEYPRLRDADHRALAEGLLRLGKDHDFEVHVVDDGTSWKDRMTAIARSTVRSPRNRWFC